MNKNDYRQIYEDVTLKKLKVVRPNKRGSSDLIPLDNEIVKNSIFLAGPCPRGNDTWDWRDDAIKILEDLDFKGTVFNPTNPYFDSIDLEKQTRWEYEAMFKASTIVFWIDRSESHPAFTTNIELGTWWDKPGVFIGFPKGSWKNDYIEASAKIKELKIYHDLKEMLTDVVKDLTRPAKNFFTSDTHFGAQRTLEFSKRPFKSVEDMDIHLISNWNKIVRPNDNVYHLGDFGEISTLRMLNFGHLYFTFGNYERRELEATKTALKGIKNVTTYNNDECIFEGKDNTYKLRHEPLGEGKYEEGTVYLFGHIHGKSSYKRNGVDVGIDTYGAYAPLPQEEVEWRVNSTLKFVDENVFTDICK